MTTKMELVAKVTFLNSVQGLPSVRRWVAVFSAVMGITALNGGAWCRPTSVGLPSLFPHATSGPLCILLTYTTRCIHPCRFLPCVMRAWVVGSSVLGSLSLSIIASCMGSWCICNICLKIQTPGIHVMLFCFVASINCFLMNSLRIMICRYNNLAWNSQFSIVVQLIRSPMRREHQNKQIKTHLKLSFLMIWEGSLVFLRLLK